MLSVHMEILNIALTQTNDIACNRPQPKGEGSEGARAKIASVCRGLLPDTQLGRSYFKWGNEHVYRRLRSDGMAVAYALAFRPFRRHDLTIEAVTTRCSDMWTKEA